MKHILIYFIKMYQAIPGPWHDRCRFYPTCSNYAIEAISTYGAFKGCFMAFKRILRCRPYGKYGFDPVIREEKNEKYY